MLTRIVKAGMLQFFLGLTHTHGTLSLSFSLWMSMNLTVSWVHQCNFMFYHHWAKTLEICLLTFRGFPSIPRGKWGFSPAWYLCSPAFSMSAPPHSVSAPCRISTSLPRRKFTALSAHIQMAPKRIWCSNSNWTGTFRSVYEWCCIPTSELEHCGFWATVSFLQNLCWIKNIYHLGKKKRFWPSNIYPEWASVSVKFSVASAVDLLFRTIAVGISRDQVNNIRVTANLEIVHACMLRCASF